MRSILMRVVRGHPAYWDVGGFVCLVAAAGLALVLAPSLAVR